MTETKGPEKKPGRKISLTLEDDGSTGFKFYLEGDVERLNQVKPSEYSAAEFWGLQFLAICKQFLDQCQREVAQTGGPGYKPKTNLTLPPEPKIAESKLILPRG